jgi:hypothetical protein
MAAGHHHRQDRLQHLPTGVRSSAQPFNPTTPSRTYGALITAPLAPLGLSRRHHQTASRHGQPTDAEQPDLHPSRAAPARTRWRAERRHCARSPWPSAPHRVMASAAVARWRSTRPGPPRRLPRRHRARPRPLCPDPDGIKVAVFYTRPGNHLLRPLAAAGQPQAPTRTTPSTGWPPSAPTSATSPGHDSSPQPGNMTLTFKIWDPKL